MSNAHENDLRNEVASLRGKIGTAQRVIAEFEIKLAETRADTARLRAALTNAYRILNNLADLDRMVPGSRYAAHVVEAREELRAALDREAPHE